MSDNQCKIKICGLTRIEDCDAVNAVLPDYAGFVFAPSRRRVDTQTAADLKRRLNKRIKTVGVFVNESFEAVAALCKAGTIDVVQLHGDEDDDFIIKLRDYCTCPIIKSVSVSDTLPKLPKEPDFLLFDTLTEKRGGSGKVFDWKLLKDFKERPYFLSGGLTSTNVKQALEILQPYCVDVSSGVETDGKKDAKKIEKFVKTIR